MTTHVDCDVLIVDDDAIALVLITRQLRDSELTLKTFVDGSEALDYLSQASVRLLLVDLRMKPMNGLELLGKLIDQKCLDSTQVYLCSAAVPNAPVMERLDQLGIKLLMKADILTVGGIEKLLKRAA